MIFYKVGDFYHYHSDKYRHHLHSSEISFKEMWEDGTNDIRFSLNLKGRSAKLDLQERFQPNEVLGRNGLPYGNTVDDVLAGINTGTDVNLSDQTTPAILAPFNKIANSTQLTNPVNINDYQITVDDPTGAGILFNTNNYLVLFDPVSIRFSQFRITAINGNVLTLDTLIDFAYPAGTFVDIGTTNLGGQVGSMASPVIFGLRGTGAPPGVDLTLDVTRVLFTARTDTLVDLSKFCDIPQLTNGLQFRRRDGEYRNIVNLKSNAGLKAIAFDWSPYAATRANEGQDGMGCRLTFAGQSKIGVAIRLPIGDDLECIITDDFTDINELGIVAEGHITNPY
jgi:hypothetical protein